MSWQKPWSLSPVGLCLGFPLPGTAMTWIVFGAESHVGPTGPPASSCLLQSRPLIVGSHDINSLAASSTWAATNTLESSDWAWLQPQRGHHRVRRGSGWLWHLQLDGGVMACRPSGVPSTSSIRRVTELTFPAQVSLGTKRNMA